MIGYLTPPLLEERERERRGFLGGEGGCTMSLISIILV